MAVATRTDEEIKQDVIDALYWDGRVDRKIAEQITAALERNVYANPDELDIKVDNGVVTLTDTVPDRRAYRVARDTVRYTPGVVDVINELLVEE